MNVKSPLCGQITPKSKQQRPQRDTTGSQRPRERALGQELTEEKRPHDKVRQFGKSLDQRGSTGLRLKPGQSPKPTQGAGQVLVILRDEQATAQHAEMARRKAYTARMFRISTMEFQKRTAGDSLQAAQRDLADILALSGGMPIQVGTDTIGAVGSAGSTLETDDACAKAGIAKVADLLK